MKKGFLTYLLIFFCSIYPAKTWAYTLSDDATGGDCGLIGIWDSSTKVCALKTNVSEAIQIISDGITLEGNGYSLIGSGSGTGITSANSNITIKKTLNLKETFKLQKIYFQHL